METTTSPRKRLLMITPENPEINRFRKQQMNNFMQITMPYLAGFVDEQRYEITLVDEYHQRIPDDKPFDLAAITVNTPNATHCYRMAAQLRARHIRVVMGGPHATLCPEEVTHHCDYLVIGEAEHTWPLFLDEFFGGQATPRYVSSQPPALDHLPIPRRDLVKGRHFTKGAVFATRGCPYQCSYCNLKQIYHPGFRTRPVAEVIDDIRSIPNRYFVFWDDNFFGDPAYALELMQALAPLRKRWAAQVSLDRCRDERLLSAARAAGGIYLFIGLESFSEDSLGSVRKSFNRVQEYQEIIRSIHAHGLSVQAGIIFGFDADDAGVFERTLEACEQMGIDGVTVSLLTPLPGTPLYDSFRREARLLSNDWTYYNGKTHVAFRPSRMSAEQLFAGYQWFRRRFFSLPSFTRRMTVSRVNLLHNLVVNLGYRLSL
jgi:radical SAM superfamily enzyme YgiQ (UPF0313 family)